MKRLIFISLFVLSSTAQASLEEIFGGIAGLNESIQATNIHNMDVHHANSKIKPHAGFLNKCNSHFFKTNYAPQMVLDQILLLRDKYSDSTNLDDQLPDITKEVAQLRNYLNCGLDFDGETGMHVSHILSAIWNYINEPLEIERQKGNIYLLYMCFIDNTLYSGGCFSGYAGRLMFVNSGYVQQKLAFIPFLDEILKLRAQHPNLDLPDITPHIDQLRLYLFDGTDFGKEAGISVSQMIEIIWRAYIRPKNKDKQPEIAKLIYTHLHHEVTDEPFEKYALKLKLLYDYIWQGA